MTAKMLTMSSGTDATLSDLTGSSKLLVPGKVISSTRIPQGTLSAPINPETLKGLTEIVQISVGASNFTKMDLDEKSKQIWNSEIHWTRALRLADDCHSYNIQLRKDNNYVINKSGKRIQTLVLQAARPVEPGQELLLWFSEELLATLHMGFLTPANIQGQKNYVCTQCSALYESPNPLKLHLTLGCGKQTMTWLWEQLSNTMLEPTRITNEFQFQLIDEPCIPKQKNAIDLSTPSLPVFKKDDSLARHFSASAFKPFKKSAASASVGFPQNNNVYNSLAHWPRYGSYMPTDYLPTPYQIQAPMPHSNNDDAQIETLVSSLGKYKEGHICLYCGKSYSRKYGLKIHIRTHTGYKPLKCKYCLRPFGDPSNLNKHVRLHAEGETPYKCDICGKVLVRRRDLERHMRSRHPDGNTSNSTFFHDDFIHSSDDDQNLTNDSAEETSENIDIEDSANTQDNSNNM